MPSINIVAGVDLILLTPRICLGSDTPAQITGEAERVQNFRKNRQAHPNSNAPRCDLYPIQNIQHRALDTKNLTGLYDLSGLV
ncbi:MAG: hypothetical protein HN916_01490 [Anaerolineae bacterium]|nr:hypothetical protein [Anaerolineae bacterium]